MALTADDIAGLVQLTQDRVIKDRAFVDAQTDIAQHVAVSQLLPRHKKVFKGGRVWRFDVQLDHNHSARAVGLYEKDGSSIVDALAKGEVGPRFTDANYVFDTKEDALQSGDGGELYNYVKTKYVGMVVSWYDYMERVLWSKPVDSSDKTTPFGIPFWVVKNSTEGFNGGNPAGFSDGRAGLSSEIYPRLKNYTATYSEISDEDLLKKLRRCVRKIQFKSPVNHAQPIVGQVDNGIYTNDNVMTAFEDILRKQNMNLGNDVAAKFDQSLFKGRPVTYVPCLDDDAQDPIYLIDWSTLCFGTIADWQKQVSSPKPVQGMHTVFQVFLDAAVNTICTDFRKQAVFYKAS